MPRLKKIKIPLLNVVLFPCIRLTESCRCLCGDKTNGIKEQYESVKSWKTVFGIHRDETLGINKHSQFSSDKPFWEFRLSKAPLEQSKHWRSWPLTSNSWGSDFKCRRGWSPYFLACCWYYFGTFVGDFVAPRCRLCQKKQLKSIEINDFRPRYLWPLKRFWSHVSLGGRICSLAVAPLLPDLKSTSVSPSHATTNATQGRYFLQPRLQKGGQEGHKQIQANTARLGSPNVNIVPVQRKRQALVCNCS